MQLYNVVAKGTTISLIPEPTFNREVARGQKLLLKGQGLDVEITSSKVEVVNRKVIR